MSNNPSVYASEADVLILGDSRANQGVDPEVVESEIKSRFGKNIKIYNLGRPGMQIPFAYFLLADYLMKAPKKPKVVIVNFSFYLLGGMQWMEDIYFSYYKPEIWQVLDAVDSKLITFGKGFSWYITSHIPFLRHKKHFKTVILENLAGEVNPMFKAYNWCTFFQNFVVSGATKGYLSNGSICVPNDKLSVESYNHYKNTIHNGYSVYTNYLKKFSDLAARHNINVVVYEFPWPEVAKGNEYFNNEILLFYKNLLKDTVKENPYVHFVDYEHFWPHELFIDPLHLNQMGANKLSKEYISKWCVDYINCIPGTESILHAKKS